MAYEELTVYAIQDENLKAFSSRFRTFTSREERDEAFLFMKTHLDSETLKTRHPVKLKVRVQTDENNQLELDLPKTG